MSPAISKRTLRELRAFLSGKMTKHQDGPLRNRLLNEIDFALTPKRSVKAARVRRVAKKKTKREEMAELRAEVFRRAEDICEACGGVAAELEHVFGRVRVKQAPSNCIAICVTCHRQRHAAKPSASYWWAVYASIFWDRGDMAEHAGAMKFAESRKDKAVRADFMALQGRTGEQT